jgi:hypothetical protein
MSTQQQVENLKILAFELRSFYLFGEKISSKLKLILGNFGNTDVTISSILIVKENNVLVRFYPQQYHIKAGEIKEITIEDYNPLELESGRYIIRVFTTRGTEVTHSFTIQK